jgi:hypothetical protein
LFDGRENTRDKWTKITHAIPDADYEHDANSNLRQILLVPESFVGRDDDLEARYDCGMKKNSVLESQPSLPTNRGYIVTCQLECECDWQ